VFVLDANWQRLLKAQTSLSNSIEDQSPPVPTLVGYCFYLLYLIALTSMHVGMDFNSPQRFETVFVGAEKQNALAGLLIRQIARRNQISATMSYTFASVTKVVKRLASE
jgi:hypothetical protein